MYRWFIALKYLTSRFITFAALLIVASAVALLIVILSVMEGFRTDLMDRIRGTSSDIRVESRGYVGLRDPAAVEVKIARVPGVRVVSPFVESVAMYKEERDAVPEDFVLEALDLAREGRVGGLPEYLAAARRRAERPESTEVGGFFIDSGRLWASLAAQPVTPEEVLSKKWLEEG